MRVSIRHQLVENVVISLDFQLEGNARLFQKVGLDIGRGDFEVGTEVDTDEFTLWGGRRACFEGGSGKLELYKFMTRSIFSMSLTPLS